MYAVSRHGHSVHRGLKFTAGIVHYFDYSLIVLFPIVFTILTARALGLH